MKSETKVGFEDRLLTEVEAAAFLGISAIKLRMQRCRGVGAGGMRLIPWIKLGKSVRYAMSDLREVIAASRVEG